MKYLNKVDPQIAQLIQKEQKRQEETLMMIPSENIASYAIEEAVGSSLGNKYAEGYPYKRYYQGQRYVDDVEQLTIERAKKLFDAPHANVQPYSGSPANFAVYTALINPGDTIMGLALAFGGHLTHGAQASATSKYFRSVQYTLGRDGFIDYDQVEKLAQKERPKIIVAGPTAYPRVIDWARFAKIADSVGAYFHADISHVAGLIVAGAYPSPINHAHTIMTTTHKTLRGPRGAIILITKTGFKKDPEIAEKIDKAVFPGLQGGPHINTIAGIGVALSEASKPSFKTYGKQVVKNAKVLATELMKYDFNLISKGTDSHLLLIDLTNKNIIGKTAAEALEAVGIILNYNAVPYDPRPPFSPSGIRLGTPGITSRSMKEKEMKVIAQYMNEALQAVAETKSKLKMSAEDEKKKINRQKLIGKTKELSKINQQIKQLCKKFPLKKIY